MPHPVCHIKSKLNRSIEFWIIHINVIIFHGKNRKNPPMKFYFGKRISKCVQSKLRTPDRHLSFFCCFLRGRNVVEWIEDRELTFCRSFALLQGAWKSSESICWWKGSLTAQIVERRHFLCDIYFVDIHGDYANLVFTTNMGLPMPLCF